MSRTLAGNVSRRRLLQAGASLLAVSVVAGCSPKEGGDAMGVDALQGVTVDPTSENVRFIGRTFEGAGATWLPQSGSGVEFEATGTIVVLEVVGDDNVHNVLDLCPRFAVLVDGAVVVDDTLHEPSRLVGVPLDESASGAVVELIHLSEAKRGMVGIRSITVKSEAARPVAPTKAKRLHIGFVGDSITCGYGVEAANTDEPFKTKTENFMKSYAYLTAQELGADYDTVCYSGYGVISGWSNDGERQTDTLVPPVYQLVMEGREQVWDFAAHRSDAVVINLGTNDRSYTGTDEARLDEFSQGYAAFLDQVRALNPDSLIVCTMGTMGGEELFPAIERAVHDHAERTGNARILCYLSEPMNVETDGCGANGHPTAVTQRKIAQTLVGVIRQALG